MDFQIQIDDNVSLPKRDVNFGPRESKYPFRQMKEGQGFAIPIVGKPNMKKVDGTVLTVEQDAERKARQKQSAFSGAAKRLGIKLNTRYVHSEPDAGDAYLSNKWAQMGGPFLLVVHGGPRDAEEAVTPEEEEAEQAEQGEVDDLLGDE
jgi:hypothetical protein